MNRATADNQSAQAEDEGLEPTKEWVKDLVDEIIAEEFSSPDLELAWLDEDEADPKGLEAVLEGRVKLDAVTLNEMRDALGLDPYANAAADRAMVLTATGYVPIEAGLGGEEATINAKDRGTFPLQEFQSSQQSALTDKPSIRELSQGLHKYGYNPGEPRIPKGNPGGGRWTDAETHLAQDDSSGIQSDAFPPYQGRGHTWMPTAVYEKYKWQEDTKYVFKNWTSGPLADPTVNNWGPEHAAYNDAAEEVLLAYLKKNNISADATETVTPAQAREIVEDVLGSRDSRISVLRKSVLREAMRYFNVYGPGRWWRGGDEE